MSRSVRIHEFGGPEVLKIEDIVVPVPESGEVRSRVRAIGLNRSEVLFRSGRAAVTPPLPSLMGLEAAGEVDAVGPDVDDFAPGDRVSIIPGFSAPGQYGYYGEVSLAPARGLVRLPANTSWSDAAATWMAYGTAWAGLIDIAGLSAGQVVFGFCGLKQHRPRGDTGGAQGRCDPNCPDTDLDEGRGPSLRRSGPRNRDAGAGSRQRSGQIDRWQRRRGGVRSNRWTSLRSTRSGGDKWSHSGRLRPAQSRGHTAPPRPRNLEGADDSGLRIAVGRGGCRQVHGDEAFHFGGSRCGRSQADDRQNLSFDEIVAAHRYLENGEKIGK
jgi:hypothetical protein